MDATLVEIDTQAIPPEPSKTKKARPKAKKKAEPSKPKASVNGKPRKAKAVENKYGVLEAAARILAGTTKPMGCHALIETMGKRGWWTSPGGKTPAATLYAAIVTEIRDKGKKSRFKKVDRGLFTARK